MNAMNRYRLFQTIRQGLGKLCPQACHRQEQEHKTGNQNDYKAGLIAIN